MHPILLELGPVTIYSYGVLLAAAYLIGLWMAARRAKKAGLDANKVLDLGIWVIIAALIGAKALLFVVDFVDVYWRGWHFWAFNVADAAISVGAALVFLELLRGNRHASHPV